MKVKDCMTEEVVTIKRSTNLSQLIEIFRKHSFHTLPVVEADNKIVGVVTFEDLLKVFQPYSRDLARMLETVPFVEKEEEDILLADISSEMGMLVIVDDLINTNFVTVTGEAPVKEARRLMKLHDSPRILVVKNGDKLTGIISLFDIILAIFKQKGIVK